MNSVLGMEASAWADDLPASWRVCATPASAPPAPGGDLSYEALVNLMCMSLDAEGQEKLALLALDNVIERGRQVRERVERRLLARESRKPGDGQQN